VVLLELNPSLDVVWRRHAQQVGDDRRICDGLDIEDDEILMLHDSCLFWTAIEAGRAALGQQRVAPPRLT
jgi:hypothetical protein